MPYTKIKYSPRKGTVSLTRVEDRGDEDSIESTLTSHESPRPEFVDALQALTPWLLNVCELPESYSEGLSVTGVSLTLGEYGGCVVTALKGVRSANAPVVLNSPHVPAQPTSEGGPSLPANAKAALDHLEEEAERFWRGERSQGELFPSGVKVEVTSRPTHTQAVQ